MAEKMTLDETLTMLLDKLNDAAGHDPGQMTPNAWTAIWFSPSFDTAFEEEYTRAIEEIKPQISSRQEVIPVEILRYGAEKYIRMGLLIQFLWRAFSDFYSDAMNLSPFRTAIELRVHRTLFSLLGLDLGYPSLQLGIDSDLGVTGRQDSVTYVARYLSFYLHHYFDQFLDKSQDTYAENARKVDRLFLYFVAYPIEHNIRVGDERGVFYAIRYIADFRKWYRQGRNQDMWDRLLRLSPSYRLEIETEKRRIQEMAERRLVHYVSFGDQVEVRFDRRMMTAPAPTAPMFGNVSFNERMQWGREYVLHVQIGLLPKNDESLRLDIKFDGQTRINIQVVIANYDGFELMDSDVQTMGVQINRGSDPVIFRVIPRKLGRQTVDVDFFQQGRYLGRRTVETLVIGKSEGPARGIGVTRLISTFSGTSRTASDDVEVTKYWSTPLNLGGEVPVPDLTIFVEKMSGLKYRLSFVSAALRLDLASSRKRNVEIVLQQEPYRYMEQVLKEVAYQPGMAKQGLNEYTARMEGIGMMLYEQLIPGEIKEMYWEEIRHKVRTVQIVSEEMWIPWELVRPFRLLEDMVEEDDFWGGRFHLTRWMTGAGTNPNPVELRNVRGLFAISNLLGVVTEKQAFERLMGVLGLDYKDVVAKIDPLLDVLEKGGFQCLHVACHGTFDREQSHQSKLWLGDGDTLQPVHVAGKRMQFGRERPIVFLNACNTGRGAPELVGLGGWADRFLMAGSSLFIGTMWEVSDASAAAFAEEFYSQIVRGRTVGFAQWQARQKIKKAGDPTWLSYTVYGDPNMCYR